MELPFERTLVFAPHPDDESVAAGCLLARASARAAQVRVVFLTDGDNNPWPQRVWWRRWRLTAEDKRRWGVMRCNEARNAITTLGLPDETATFLHFPDTGLPAIEHGKLIDAVTEIVSEFRPTLLVIPSPRDYHPDHRAAFRATVRALRRVMNVDEYPLTLSYVVHGTIDTRSPNRMDGADDERQRKTRAVRCHATQLLLSSGRFLRYAAREEVYNIVTDFSPQDETWVARWAAKLRHIASVLGSYS